MDHLHAVIMAGGRGTRFWPRSVRGRPKQLLEITGGRTMIQETVARIAPLIPPERTWVVTGNAEVAELVAQLPGIPERQILVEPRGRNTAPCIALATQHLRHRDADAVMAVLPADHAIADAESFRGALRAAAEAASEHRVLVTFGVTPTSPETGYGYIARGPERAIHDGYAFYEAAAFREKPDRETARRMVAGGRHLWNAGIFVWRVDVIHEALARYLPEMAARFEVLGAAVGRAGLGARTAQIYEQIEGVSIDYGVLERARDVWVLPCACGWNDVGSWAALFEVLERDASGNATSGDALLLDARDNLVSTSDRLVALLGVDGLVVVVSDRAVLVCARDRAQDVRDLVTELERQGREDVL